MNFEDRSFAKSFVDFFYPLVEFSRLNVKGEFVEVFNSFSSLKEDQGMDLKNAPFSTPFLELLKNGRSVRCLIYPFKESSKQVKGYLRLRFDLTLFKNLQEQLSFLVQPTEVTKHEDTDTWRESIDSTIQQYLTEFKINLQALTSKQKRELISMLQNKGLLDFKESSAYIATKLDISRATLYNYLKTASHFKKIHVHQVDAFTNDRFGGNPAGVVLDAETLDESTMRKITRELNLSETAFVMPSEHQTLRMRYFTPTGHELSFCGHSTVGSLYMIAKERRFGLEKAGTYALDVETLSGVLKMEATIEEGGEIRVAYETPIVKLNKSKISFDEIAAAGGFERSIIDSSFPIVYEETNRDLFVVIRSLEDLKSIECDTKSLAQFSKEHDIVVLCLVVKEPFDPSNNFHMRCFAPMVGISEDPFTGSVLGGLAVYADSFGLLPKKASTFKVEQGHFLERPGVVTVKFSKTSGKYNVKVFAQAVHCFSTEINLI